MTSFELNDLFIDPISKEDRISEVLGLRTSMYLFGESNSPYNKDYEKTLLRTWTESRSPNSMPAAFLIYKILPATGTHCILPGPPMTGPT